MPVINQSIRRWRTPIGAAVFILAFLSTSTSWGQGPSASPVFNLPSDSQEIVVRWVERIGAIENDEGGISMTLYSDGRMVVVIPSFMKRAGRSETRLTQAEMQRIIRSLLDKGLADFDSAAMLSRKSTLASRARVQHLVDRSDVSTTQIELQINQYQPISGTPGSPLPARDVQKTISWPGLRGDARKFPEIEEIQDLEAAARELRALIHHPNLAPRP